MRNPFGGKEIWLRTGSQGLYGPETLDQVAAQSQQLAGTLDAAEDIPVRIVWKPGRRDSESTGRTPVGAGGRDLVRGVLAWTQPLAPAKMLIRGLEALLPPLLHLHTQVHERMPWSEIDMDF